MERNQRIYADSHVHTRFSSDSEASVHGQVEAAIAGGVGYLCFTDHMDYDYPDMGDGIDFLFSPAEYMQRMQEVKQSYAGQIDIGIGIEMGLQLQVLERAAETVRTYPFDFVIASMHLVKGTDPYYKQIWKQYSPKELYTAYFEETLENIRRFDEFDALGHLDYIARYGRRYCEEFGYEDPYTYKAFGDMIDEILRVLIEKGKGLECNTGGLKDDYPYTNPGRDIIRRYIELGGEIVTMGSDAHKREFLALQFEQACSMLQEQGVRNIAVYRRRKPVMLSLE